MMHQVCKFTVAKNTSIEDVVLIYHTFLYKTCLGYILYMACSNTLSFPVLLLPSKLFLILIFFPIFGTFGDEEVKRVCELSPVRIERSSE